MSELAPTSGTPALITPSHLQELLKRTLEGIAEATKQPDTPHTSELDPFTLKPGVAARIGVKVEFMPEGSSKGGAYRITIPAQLAVLPGNGQSDDFGHSTARELSNAMRDTVEELRRGIEKGTRLSREVFTASYVDFALREQLRKERESADQQAAVSIRDTMPQKKPGSAIKVAPYEDDRSTAIDATTTLLITGEQLPALERNIKAFLERNPPREDEKGSEKSSGSFAVPPPGTRLGPSGPPGRGGF